MSHIFKLFLLKVTILLFALTNAIANSNVSQAWTYGAYGTPTVFKVKPLSMELCESFDVSTGSHTATLSVGINTPTDLQWNSDGTRLYILDNTSKQIKQFDCSTAYDISTASFTSGNTASINLVNNQGFAFNPTMTKMIVCNSGGETVEQYTCG